MVSAIFLTMNAVFAPVRLSRLIPGLLVLGTSFPRGCYLGCRLAAQSRNSIKYIYLGARIVYHKTGC